MGTAPWLLMIAPAGLGVAAALAGSTRRRRLLAWALASVPLSFLLASNLAAAHGLLHQDPRGALPLDALREVFTDFLLWGLGPALAGWVLLWRAEADRSGDAGLDAAARAGLAAGATLAVVAALGAALVGLTAAEATTAVHAGVWSTVPFSLVLGLSVVGAVAEEVLFRGVILHSLMPTVGWPAAAGLQGVLFGVLHAGYGDPWYVLGAAAFGLGLAYVAARFGLLVATVVHVQVNLVVLGWLSRHAHPSNAWIVAGVVAVNAAVLAAAAWRMATAEAERSEAPRMVRWVRGRG